MVDNTSPSSADRAALISIGHARDAARAGRGRIPLAGMLATRSRLVPPSAAEGFDQVDVVRT